ncbi:hypothetical protein PV10_01695 [Exophiala mesophila]|uniref:Zn(2)-C6 fungal-type domain-containing protein n=1 Tax=Exophiala mesophila TaxID=212818 RepID=A0A0D1YBM6_EXOME|nr:uncharacterized protein PV10_01695 [Exophiala mesophila]KIV98001.1 hypothetical protein PV10_01695 [Exophiala mesophila]
MVGRPRRSCFRCNNQKVRCNGVRPTCDRCKRIRHICSYEGAQPEPYGYVSSPRSSTANVESRYADREEQQSSPRQPDFQARYCGIPRSLIGDLVDIYFSHVYNARLLLHKDTVVEAVSARTATSHVVLSICAFASKYYRDAAGNHSLSESGFGQEWASIAGSMVATELGEPKEENIVTFINLALYWYSEGEWRKAFIYKWNGIQIAYVLGVPAPSPHGTTSSLRTEVTRRRFWACACIMLFGSKADFVVSTLSDSLTKVPLPCPESRFGKDTLSPPTESGHNTIFAALIHILMLWNAVYQSVKDGDLQLNTLQSLNSRIESWNTSLPSDLEFSPDSLNDALAQDQHLVLLLHTIYDQCLCTLHSSIVPLFCWGMSCDGT